MEHHEWNIAAAKAEVDASHTPGKVWMEYNDYLYGARDAAQRAGDYNTSRTIDVLLFIWHIAHPTNPIPQRTWRGHGSYSESYARVYNLEMP